MKASILAVGTEVTDGEINNSNSQWLSRHLVELNISPVLHMTVADHKEDMLDAMNYCLERAELLFITGGLGPTVDDFTRNVVAELAGKELVFNEGELTKIEKRFTEMGRTISEGHKFQCHFPEGSHLLENSAGTAAGFVTKIGSRQIINLPGPPREIDAIWNDGLLQLLQSIAPPPSEILKVWKCTGVGESDVSRRIEPLAKDYRLGFRVSKPYIYIKLWHPVDEDMGKLYENIENEISQWLVND